MNIDIPYLDEIPTLIDRVERLTAALSGAIEPQTEPKYWYTLEDAFRARGGASFHTFRNESLDHPRLGIPDGHQHGRRVWSRATIERWVKVSDETRTEYFDELLETDFEGTVLARLKTLCAKDACRYRDYVESLPVLPGIKIAQ